MYHPPKKKNNNNNNNKKKIDPFPADVYLKGNTGLNIGISYINLFVMKFYNHLVAMDTKFGRIYCATSDIEIYFIFSIPTPSNFYRS